MGRLVKYFIPIALLNAITVFTYGSQLNKDSLLCKAFTDTIYNVEYYLVADTMPEYPGGPDAMDNYFQSNFQFPDIDATGRLVVEFIIDAEGNMTNLKVIRGIHSVVDEEALRVMRSMPKWKPAKCNGKAVPVKLFHLWKIYLQ